MASSTLPPKVDAPPHPISPISGVLSYLVPGLGQILQGRVAKGLLFLVCIYALFFYGLYLGTMDVTLALNSQAPRAYHVVGNVYLPHADDPQQKLPPPMQFFNTPLMQNLYARPQFVGQFWVGIAAWPAIVQYLHYNRAEVQAIDDQIDRLFSDLKRAMDEKDNKEIARIQGEIQAEENNPRYRHPSLGHFMREPSPAEVNVVTNAGDKRLELAWVFTVIAGVLNIMVIYDAVAGPAFPSGDDEEKKD